MSYSVVTSPVVSVTVTSSLTSFASEKRFPKDLTIAALKVYFSLYHALLHCFSKNANLRTGKKQYLKLKKLILKFI